MSIYLAIDTASTAIALALQTEDGAIRTRILESGADHSKVLLPAINELPGAERSRLAGVAVVRGPGSYAGLRVGIATATGIAVALGVPLRGVSTLEAVADVAGGEGVLIHPAGRGEFAAQEWRDGRPVGPIRTLAPSELRGERVAGEGAGALGGIEIGPDARCAAALRLAIPHLRAGATGEADAIYLREPNITLSRKTPVAPR